MNRQAEGSKPKNQTTQARLLLQKVPKRAHRGGGCELALLETKCANEQTSAFPSLAFNLIFKTFSPFSLLLVSLFLLFLSCFDCRHAQQLLRTAISVVFPFRKQLSHLLLKTNSNLRDFLFQKELVLTETCLRPQNLQISQ